MTRPWYQVHAEALRRAELQPANLTEPLAPPAIPDGIGECARRLIAWRGADAERVALYWSVKVDPRYALVARRIREMQA